MTVEVSMKITRDSNTQQALLKSAGEAEYYCKSLDGKIQVLGLTPGEALERFLELMQK